MYSNETKREGMTLSFILLYVVNVGMEYKPI